MLRSDFSRKAHPNFQNFVFCIQCVFSSTMTSNRRQFHVKLKSILNQILILVFLSTFSTISSNKHKKIRLF